MSAVMRLIFLLTYFDFVETIEQFLINDKRFTLNYNQSASCINYLNSYPHSEMTQNAFIKNSSNCMSTQAINNDSVIVGFISVNELRNNCTTLIFRKKLDSFVGKTKVLFYFNFVQESFQCFHIIPIQPNISILYDKQFETLKIKISNHKLLLSIRRDYYHLCVLQLKADNTDISWRHFFINNNETEIFVKQQFNANSNHCITITFPNNSDTSDTSNTCHPLISKIFTLSDIQQSISLPKCTRNGTLEMGKYFNATVQHNINKTNINLTFKPDDAYKQFFNMCLPLKVTAEIYSMCKNKSNKCNGSYFEQAMTKEIANEEIFSTVIRNLTYETGYRIKFVVKACSNIECKKVINYNITIPDKSKPDIKITSVVNTEDLPCDNWKWIVGCVLCAILLAIPFGIWMKYIHNKSKSKPTTPMQSLTVFDHIQTIKTKDKIKISLISCMKNEKIQNIVNSTIDVFNDPLYCEVLHITPRTVKQGLAKSGKTLAQDWIDEELNESEVTVVIAPDTNLERKFLNKNYKAVSDDELYFKACWEKLRRGHFKRLYVIGFKNIIHYPILQDIYCTSFQLIDDLGLLFNELHRGRLRSTEQLASGCANIIHSDALCMEVLRQHEHVEKLHQVISAGITIRTHRSTLV